MTVTTYIAVLATIHVFLLGYIAICLAQIASRLDRDALERKYPEAHAVYASKYGDHVK